MLGCKAGNESDRASLRHVLSKVIWFRFQAENPCDPQERNDSSFVLVPTYNNMYVSIEKVFL
jgi:hypothetical protein